MKFRFPEIEVKKNVVSSHFHCKDAVIVKVKGGKDALRFEEVPCGYEVLLNDESMFSVNEKEFCPTCGGYLRRGYGEQNLSMKEALELSAKMNESYTGIENAVERMSPLLGLLKDGYYMVADYELFPFTGNTHFWEFHEIPALFTAWGGCLAMENCRTVSRPEQLMASERATMFQPERVDYYMERLEEEEHYPRAIGCYLSGNTVLLLDGHHKVAAAAAKGKMAKCLVVMPVELEKDENENPLLQVDNVLLNNAGDRVGVADEFFGRKVCMNYDRNIPEPACFSEWGVIPKKYHLDVKAYKEIPREAETYEAYSKYDVGFRDNCTYFLREKNKSRAAALFMLTWYQILKNDLRKNQKKGKSFDFISLEQEQALSKVAYAFKLDQDPKTANLIDGLFSFYAGQTRIDKIPDGLAYKLNNEEIKTILIPNTVKEIKKEVFKSFPDLKKIIVQKGSTFFAENDFEDVISEIKQMKRNKKTDEERKKHLYYRPFAEIGELLK